MNWLIILILRSLAIGLAAYLVPGVEITSYGTALAAAVVLGLLNMFLKPLLVILTIPVTILTLGLFTLVINAIIVMLTANIVPGFTVSSFGSAFVFSIVLGLINWFLTHLSE